MFMINRITLFIILFFSSIYCQDDGGFSPVYARFLSTHEKYPGPLVEQNKFIPIDTMDENFPKGEFVIFGPETSPCVVVSIPGVYLIQFSVNLRGQSMMSHVPVSVAVYLNLKLQTSSITTTVIHEPYSEGVISGSTILKIPKNATIALGNPGKYPFIVQGLFVDDGLYSSSVNLTLIKIEQL